MAVATKSKPRIKGGEGSPLAAAPRGGASATPLSGGHPRNAPNTIWPTVPIGSVSKIFDGPHATPNKVSSGPIFLGINSLDHGRLNLSNTEHLSEQDFSKWTRRVEPRTGDIVFSYETRIGEAALIPDGLRCCLGRRMGLIRCDVSKINSRFLLYQYLSPVFQAFIKSRTIHGSTVDRISINEFPDFPVMLPPLKLQQVIAETLGCLDDKIENNRRMNEILEAMARALFQDWFVDFGPVRAKMEGREPPGLRAEYSALFPSKIFNDLPSGWMTKKLGDTFRLTMGQSPPGETYNEAGEGMPFYQGRTDFGFRFPSRRVYCTAPTRTGSPGDTLVSVRAPVGDINMALETSCLGRGIAAVRHNSGAKSFTYYSLWSMQEQLKVFEHNGTVFGAINKNHFEGLRVLDPGSALIDTFEAIVAPLDSTIERNSQEIEYLGSLRDSLLPKLLSGELRISEAERQVP